MCLAPHLPRWIQFFIGVPLFLHRPQHLSVANPSSSSSCVFVHRLRVTLWQRAGSVPQPYHPSVVAAIVQYVQLLVTVAFYWRIGSKCTPSSDPLLHRVALRRQCHCMQRATSLVWVVLCRYHGVDRWAISPLLWCTSCGVAEAV